MFNFLIKQRSGRFLLIGTILLLAGFMLSFNQPILSNICYYFAIFFLGFFAAKNAILSTIENKSLNVDLLMVLAALGAVAIDYASEGAMLLFIFALAENLEAYANGKSTASIEALMSQVPNTAQKLGPNGEVVTVLTEDLKKGDVVVVSKGQQLPIDGILDRSSQVNEAALTGESVPVHKEAGEEVFAGTINEGNVFHITVSKLASETVFSNIIRMVEEAQGRPSRVSSLIDRIESKYVVGVLIAVPIFIGLLYYVVGLDFQTAFYRGMVFLTVASPCALVASATPATLSAISNGARNGVLTKGGASFEALSQMTQLFTDKTGTLTFGDFKVVDYQADDQVIAEVVYMEQQSSHPIAEAIVNHFNTIDLSQVDTSQAVEEVAGKGVKKGTIKVGKPSAFADYDDPHHYRDQLHGGHTSIFVAQGQEIVGFFSLADQVRPTALEAVPAFQAAGVKVDILTGDNESVTSQVAKQVGADNYYASLLPEDKINHVNQAQAAGTEMVGMIGDGINDAPALAAADIGIAMGSGSSVAMESADVVIVKNDLSKLYYSYRLSQKLAKLIKQNIIFAVGVIILLVVFNLFGLISLPLAVVCHEGSTILVIFNGLRLLKQNDDSSQKDIQLKKIFEQEQRA
ncbi:ATPase [Aerococcus urinaehominis]|uniref:ATPase n=1 Tax=Aerococcus urinaehominis TaxID=128944 RepID=A0A0X8FJT6_9LACT|nr:heavy metal translocating P-type ATPase [Aerococcus urinaehominis]AMB98645.1 ATPase [Aerococcus urinaehominis]SDL96720.1 Cd2+/Zn2+-exporting ATPase [Aerococcus urinaehominis]